MKKFKYIICWIFLAIFSSHPLMANEISAQEITENDFIIGDENAPITIIEYASMSCSHCADFHTNTLPDLKTEFIDTGKVRMVFRDYPFNYPALLGSMMMRCIPGDVRYDYMNALYQLQPNWVNIGQNQIKKVVCGAENAKEGLLTIYAPPGAIIPKTKTKLDRKSVV